MIFGVLSGRRLLPAKAFMEIHGKCFFFSVILNKIKIDVTNF